MLNKQTLSYLFTELLTTSENMLTAASSDDWDEVMKLDKVRYQLLEDLLAAKNDLNSDLIGQQSKALSKLDDKIIQALRAAKVEHSSSIKQAKNNRSGLNQYLDGQGLPVR